MIIFFSLTGSFISHKNQKREKILEKILVMLRLVCTQIGYFQSPIDVIIDKLSQNEELKILDFLEICKENLNELDFPDAWRVSVEQSEIHKSDKELLLSFGFNMGTSNIEGQLSNCEMHRELFENKLNSVRDKNRKNGKLYTALGIMTGCLIFVVLV